MDSARYVYVPYVYIWNNHDGRRGHELEKKEGDTRRVGEAKEGTAVM